MQAAVWQNDGSAPLTQLQRLQANRQRTLVLVIDQFELLVGGTDADGQETEADRFLAFLQELLGLRAAGLLVLATMRIDFMPLLQNRCQICCKRRATCRCGRSRWRISVS